MPAIRALLRGLCALLVLGMFVQTSHAANFAPELEPGAIVGRVESAATGAPIGGAIVYYGQLSTSSTLAGWWEGTPASHHPHVVTSNTGRFEIKPLRPGHFYLVVVKPGYVTQRRQVEVVSGKITETVFKLVRMEPAPAATIAGRVIDAVTSHPIKSVFIYFELIEDHSTTGGGPYVNDLIPIMPHHGTTNAEGRYVIERLRPGIYRLKAVREGYQPESRVVTAPAGVVTEANFKLQPLPPRKGAIAGRVTDALTSAPLAGVKLWVLPAGEMVIAGEARSAAPAIAVVYGQAETNNLGEYRIEGIPAGPVKVLANREGYRPADRRVQVIPDATVRVDFKLQPIVAPPTGAVVGRVTNAETSAPLARAIITLIPKNDLAFELSRVPGSPRHTLTDANGEYAFRHVPAGGYVITAVRHEFKPQRETIQVIANASLEVNFRLEPLELPRFGSIRGKVVDDATSRPVAGAWIMVDLGSAENLGAHDRLVTHTNANGIFEFGRVPVGTWPIHAARRGYEPARQEVTIEAGRRANVLFRLHSLGGYGGLEGVVTSAATGEPIAGAHVVVPLIGVPHTANAQSALHGETGNDGRYSIAGIPAGMRKAAAFARGYVGLAQAVEITSLTTATLDFALTPRPVDEVTTLTIRAINARTGQPLTGARIHVPSDDWVEPFCEWDLNQWRTGGNGIARCGGVPLRARTLIATLEGYLPVFVTLPAPGETGEPSAVTLAGEPVDITLSFIPDTGTAARDWSLYD